jgi:hypothetical protein
MEMIRQFSAIVLDTLREARARKVFLAMTMSGTLSALLMLWYVQTIASRAPSSRLTAMARIDPRYLDNSFASHMVYAQASSMLLWVQMLFAVTMTLGMLAPLLDAKRNVIPASAPVPRSFILLGRYAGALSTAAAGVAVAFGELWILISLKFGVWHPRFLLGAAVTVLAVAAAVALLSLLQVAVKSQATAFVGLVAFSLLSLGAQYPDRLREMTGSEWLARSAAALGSILPRYPDMAEWTRVFVGSGDMSHWPVLCASAISAVFCLSAACLVFSRKEF